MRKNTQVALETEESKRARENTESIAKNIAALAKSVEGLLSGPLKRRALVILLANSSGLAQTHVDKVLTALADLEKDWLR
jgi:hypothetical protein